MSTLATTNLKNPSSGSDNIVLGADGSSTLGTAKITTLADSAGANTSTPAEIASGRAKAWVNFNGTGTVAIRAQYNVSSITDNGVGDYTVNFATALADANYCVTGHAGAPGVATGFIHAPTGGAGNKGTSAMRFSTHNPAGTATDMSFVDVAIFR
jgi:hypothetical protein